MRDRKKQDNIIVKINQDRSHKDWIARANNQKKNLRNFLAEHKEPFKKREFSYLITITRNIINCLHNAANHPDCPERDKEMLLNDKKEFLQLRKEYIAAKQDDFNLKVILEIAPATAPAAPTKRSSVYDAKLVRERQERQAALPAKQPIPLENEDNMTLDLSDMSTDYAAGCARERNEFKAPFPIKQIPAEDENMPLDLSVLPTKRNPSNVISNAKYITIFGKTIMLEAKNNPPMANDLSLSEIVQPKRN